MAAPSAFNLLEIDASNPRLQGPERRGDFCVQTIGKPWENAGFMRFFIGIYPLVMTNTAMEAMAHL